jgi:pre-mRNA branch site protein p14
MSVTRPGAVSLYPFLCLYMTINDAPVKSKLPPGANRILFVKNLNYQISGEDIYELFGRYGQIRQVRLGSDAKTKGTAFVVFEDVMDVSNSF